MHILYSSQIHNMVVIMQRAHEAEKAQKLKGY